MPPLLVAFAIIGGLLILVALLPHLEIRMPRRYRDIVYFRMRRNGGRIDVWRGKPVACVATYEFDWTDAERPDFDSHGLPIEVDRTLHHVRRQLRPHTRRFPFRPIIILHAIDKAMGGLTDADRRRLNRLGAALGDQVLIGDLPNAFPDRAFHELRENGMAPWGEN